MNNGIRLTFFITLLLGIFILPSTAFSQLIYQNTTSRLIKAGLEQLKSGDYQGARDSFEEAVRYDDASPAAHTGLGVAYFHLRNDKDAERELRRAVELNPKEAVAYQFLGELYYRKDDLDTAAMYWEKAVEINPSESALSARLERIRKEQ